MKIAIKGHALRGKEVIQILESLGGKNKWFHYGNNKNCFYELHDDCIWCATTRSEYFKYYTLEEFEKEFPFKVGDKVIALSDNKPYKIIALEHYNGKLCYKLDNGFHYQPRVLKSYKEMKEERNITLTLDKAKEWYNKDGELREVALQAYSEEELTKVELPKTWEEFCKNYSKRSGEAYISNVSSISEYPSENIRRINIDKNVCPSKKSAEAHLAMIQLEQLRDCWRQGNIPQEFKYKIRKVRNEYTIVYGVEDSFLSFCNKQTSEEFLECFRDLIKKAGDLI